jgi:hypothetical protein
MNKRLCLLLIFGFVVLINCKGGGGRGGGGGHSYGHSSGGGRGGGGGKSHYFCSRTVFYLPKSFFFISFDFLSGGSNGLMYIVLIPFGLICVCCFCYACHQKDKGEPCQTNETFVALNRRDVERGAKELYLNNAFQSGTCSCRYYQYGAWHGPHLLSLSFNDADMTIKGSGTDDVGTFTADGIYSKSTRRIGLTEHYQRGTGDPSQNLGHDVAIQVIYNAQRNQFEGKWYVQTHKYHGEGQIEFKFVEPA